MSVNPIPTRPLTDGATKLKSAIRKCLALLLHELRSPLCFICLLCLGKQLVPHIRFPENIKPFSEKENKNILTRN